MLYGYCMLVSYSLLRAWLFNARISFLAVGIAALAAGQGAPDIQTQDLILEEPRDVGFGSGVGWDEPYLVAANAQRQQVSLIKRTSSGWILLDQIEDATPAISLFANSIATNDDWVFVPDIAFNSFRGRVSVFRRVNERLVRTEEITNPSPVIIGGNPGGFGRALASARKWLVVTSAGENDGTGAARVYRLQDQNWVLAQELRSPFPDNRFFGRGCAISPSGVIVIGDGETSTARLHVYRLVAGRWVLDQIINDPNNISTSSFVDNFGESGAIDISRDGRFIIAGDRHGESLGGFFAGDAHLFEYMVRAGTAEWVEVAKFEASNDFGSIASSTPNFGQTVAIHGDTVLVGSPTAYGLNDEPFQGAIYGFQQRADGSWPATEDFRLVRDPGSGRMGRSLEFDGSTVFTGPDVGFANLSIFELGKGVVRCDGLSGARLNVLGDSLVSDFTVSIQDAPPGSNVRLFAALDNVGSTVYTRSTGLCLSADAFRIGVPHNAGTRGSVYFAGLSSLQSLGCQPTLCGTSVTFQAILSPAGPGVPFSTSQAVSIPLSN